MGKKKGKSELMCDRCGILFKLPGSKYCIQHKEKKK
jgi:hypothetical protein